MQIPPDDLGITFVQTGGTIDKAYPRGDDDHGCCFAIRGPAFRRILRQSHIMFRAVLRSAARKDSNDLEPKHLERIKLEVLNSHHPRVVITHGTDTILRTAEYLSDDVGDHVVVLTGAMLPARFVNSDAKFNLGMAVAAVQSSLPFGVYVALYGRVVPWRDYGALSRAYEGRVK